MLFTTRLRHCSASRNPLLPLAHAAQLKSLEDEKNDNKPEHANKEERKRSTVTRKVTKERTSLAPSGAKREKLPRSPSSSSTDESDQKETKESKVTEKPDAGTAAKREETIVEEVAKEAVAKPAELGRTSPC